jgi:hypothetical protein
MVRVLTRIITINVSQSCHNILGRVSHTCSNCWCCHPHGLVLFQCRVEIQHSMGAFGLALAWRKDHQPDIKHIHAARLLRAHFLKFVLIASNDSSMQQSSTGPARSQPACSCSGGSLGQVPLASSSRFLVGFHGMFTSDGSFMVSFQQAYSSFQQVSDH